MPLDAAQPETDRRTPNAMTVDIEDYFQVYAFHDVIDRADWDSFEWRVEPNTERVLDLFARTGTKATFFTLGMIAERYPALMRRITAAGHELASHGWAHFHVFEQDRDSFRADIRRTKAVLEDTGGQAVRGYRAASFSINPATWWAFEILADEGYAYSSSVNPIRHDHYGVPDAPRAPFRPTGLPIVELPITTREKADGRRVPAGGGGYFRLLPYGWFAGNLARLNRDEAMSGMFYFHPWEIDPGQPRIKGARLKSRFRHYVNLAGMEAKLERLLRAFRWDRVDRVFAPEASRLPEWAPTSR